MGIQAHEQSQLSKYRALAEERMAQLTAVRRMLALQGELVKKQRQELTQVQESHAYLQRDYEALRHSQQWLEDATIVFVIQEFAPTGWADKHFCYGSEAEAQAMLDKCGDGRHRLVAHITVELARKG